MSKNFYQNKISKIFYFKSFVVLMLLIGLSSFGYVASVVGYGGGSSFVFLSNNSSAPLVVNAANTFLTISPTQTGSISRDFDNGSNINVDLEKGAVSSKIILDVSLGIIENDSIPQESTGAEMIDNYSYNIVATDLNDEYVKEFLKDLVITITVPNLLDSTNNIGLYYYDENSGDWIFVPDTNFDFEAGQIAFRTNHLTEYAVFIYDNQEDYSRLETTNSGQVKSSSVGGSSVIAGSLYGLKSEDVDIISSVDARIINTTENKVDLNSSEKNIFEKISSNSSVSTKTKYEMAYFIKHGTDTTKSLGAGERGGVVNSYQEAFGNIPQNEEEWQDVVKIANGRWPAKRNQEREDMIKNEQFIKIYNRVPDMSNQNDDAAIVVMAYGLRPANRNTNSEVAAIKIFESIYSYSPSTASQWDIVRAIAYSGAVR